MSPMPVSGIFPPPEGVPLANAVALPAAWAAAVLLRVADGVPDVELDRVAVALPAAEIVPAPADGVPPEGVVAVGAGVCVGGR